jgi:ubiquinol-cytochrome c reductase cytochrome b subunit
MGSICILFALPLLDRSKIRGIQFKPLMKISFWAFIANFLLLLKIGGLHPEEPYITLGLISTIFYFSWFLLILPLVSSIEKNLAFNPLLRGWNKNSTLSPFSSASPENKSSKIEER